jgi:L-prolyl-PCP dehydrogenase
VALGFAGFDLGVAFSIAAHVFACAKPIEKFGDEEQKRRWLPPMCSGELIATHAITEPEAGSDIFAMRTVARRDGADYVLNGAKCFSTNAPVADLLLVHARTAEQPGFFSLSAFLVDAKSKGVTVGAPYEKIGLEGSPTADLYFEECRVPENRRIAGEGMGASIFMHSMTWERTCLFGIYIGAMERALEDSIQHARSRKQFGQAIGKLQGVSHKIADMKVRLDAARLLLYRSAWSIERGGDDSTHASIAKLFVSEAAVASALDAMQIHGGSGVVAGRIERYLRDALPSRVFSGTSEIQKNNIARALGL